MNSITEVAVAFSPVAIALITGFFAAWANRRPRSDKILARLNSEISAISSMQDGVGAKTLITAQIDATALKYQETCAREDALRRDPIGVVAGAVISVGGIALATWSVSKGGNYIWWWTLAVPAIMIGVFGFFYELAGGKSTQSTSASPTPTTTV